MGKKKSSGGSSRSSRVASSSNSGNDDAKVVEAAGGSKPRPPRRGHKSYERRGEGASNGGGDPAMTAVVPRRRRHHQYWISLLVAFFSLLLLVVASLVLKPSSSTTTTASEKKSEEDDYYCAADYHDGGRRRECSSSQRRGDDDHFGGHGDGDDDGYDDNYFYAWPTPAGEDSLMYALFADTGRLESAWETHPLLSRASFSNSNEQQQVVEASSSPPDDAQIIIPTILHDRSSVLSLLPNLPKGHADAGNDDDDDPIISMFYPDDIVHVLSQNMHHGSDYTISKKIVLPPDHPTEPGEEYLGTLPNPSYTVQEVFHHFHYGEFSVVINNMQKRWGKVARVARRMEDELGVVKVGVNLYLTPEVPPPGEEEEGANGDVDEGGGGGGVRQGFEAHWDMMDVMIIQLSGRKRWSVAREPSVYLSSKDQKRKPMRRELESLARYSEFTLCPGDVLYIPRGYVHNASTVDFDDLMGKNYDGSDESESDGGARHDLDGCPPYPTDLARARALSDRVDGSSLHLTFGLLQSNDATIETLLHHALDAYFASSAEKGDDPRPGVAAIPKRACPGGDHDVSWRSVLHHTLAEVSRRVHRCDTILSGGGVDAAGGKLGACNGTATLRQSVPLLLLENNRLKEEKMTTINEEGENDDDDRQYSNLRITYTSALRTFTKSASISKTMDFIKDHLFVPPEHDGMKFHYPGYSDGDVILCPDAMRALKKSTLLYVLNGFHEFASDNFHQVLMDMNRWGMGQRKEHRQHQQWNLRRVGQEAPL